MAGDDVLRRIDHSLRRIDRHIERGNELFARNTEAFERNREAFERTISTLERVDRRLDQSQEREEEHRLFIRETTERNARITDSLIAAIQSFSADLQAEISDQREQIQANTQAILRVLDRFPPGPLEA
jgi:ABC-type transporter Mla subunit MlaD